MFLYVINKFRYNTYVKTLSEVAGKALRSLTFAQHQTSTSFIQSFIKSYPYAHYLFVTHTFKSRTRKNGVNFEDNIKMLGMNIV